MSELPDEALDPRNWLRRAESNLACARAGHGAPNVLLEDLCFHAQQAAEKAIKALLISRSIDFPRTHALAHLLELMDARGIALPADVKKSSDLTTYAVWTRYPGGPAVTEADYQSALQVAEAVVAWVTRQLAANGAET